MPTSSPVPHARPAVRARRALALAAAILIAGAVATVLRASSPQFFEAATQDDFLKGEVTNLSIDAEGRLALGFATELVYESSSPFLWSVTPGPDDTMFIGSGNDGRVFRVDASGRGSLLFDSAELEVHALAPGPDGSLFVGTSPDGRIYKVARDGTATTFFDPDDKYIWALATDAAGNLYAGTGEHGLVYKIAPDGTGKPFYDTKATHAVALAFDHAGNLLVGTGSPGRVIRVDPSGKGFVLLDSPFDEIHALRFDSQGVLYAAAQNARAPAPAPSQSTSQAAPSAPAPSRQPTASVSVEVTSVTVADTSSTPQPTAASRASHGVTMGAVYRIPPDGLWDEIWESRDDAPYDIAFEDGSSVLVATGNDGKIFRLAGNPPVPSLVARAEAQQVTSLFRDRQGRITYATANPGKLFRLSSNRATDGTYESEALDAQMVSSWGAVSWRATAPSGTSVAIATRSGNTETPDDTWSDWSAAYTTPDGSAITSPKARYLQWRATLHGTAGASPVLTSVRAAYLQRNVRPVVQSITVHPPGIVFQKPFSTGEPDLAGFDNETTPARRLEEAAANSNNGNSQTPALGRRAYEKGLETLIWRADDANGDDLRYDLYYRREDQTGWTVLRTGLTDPIFVWDTTTVPDGTYFVRVVASDAPSNAPAEALEGESTSDAFDIDNTPPAISGATARIDGTRTRLALDVTDSHSRIGQVEYSLDGLSWVTVFPADGISDSPKEHYEVTIEGRPDARGITLRASDAMNNVTMAHVEPR